jgi:hypothetical protein
VSCFIAARTEDVMRTASACRRDRFGRETRMSNVWAYHPAFESVITGARARVLVEMRHPCAGVSASTRLIAGCVPNGEPGRASGAPGVFITSPVAPPPAVTVNVVSALSSFFGACTGLPTAAGNRIGGPSRGKSTVPQFRATHRLWRIDGWVPHKPSALDHVVVLVHANDDAGGSGRWCRPSRRRGAHLGRSRARRDIVSSGWA